MVAAADGGLLEMLRGVVRGAVKAAREEAGSSSGGGGGTTAASTGDSPQGKSDVVQSRQGGGFYPTRGRVAQNERDKERDEETERGV
jgi:hypothetical protein